MRCGAAGSYLRRVLLQEGVARGLLAEVVADDAAVGRLEPGQRLQEPDEVSHRQLGGLAVLALEQLSARRLGRLTTHEPPSDRRRADDPHEGTLAGRRKHFVDDRRIHAAIEARDLMVDPGQHLLVSFGHRWLTSGGWLLLRLLKHFLIDSCHCTFGGLRRELLFSRLGHCA